MQTARFSNNDLQRQKFDNKIMVIAFFNTLLTKNEDKLAFFANSSVRGEVPVFSLIIKRDKDYSPPLAMFLGVILAVSVLIGICFYHYKKKQLEAKMSMSFSSSTDSSVDTENLDHMIRVNRDRYIENNHA